MSSVNYFLSFFFTILITCFMPLHPLVKDIISGVKVVHINSLSQAVKDKKKITFDGEVEILIDQSMHIWADHVIFDKEKQTLIACGLNGRSISIEDNTFFMLADCISLNIAEKTGYTQNLRLHVDEGYIAARKASKINDTDWEMEGMVYTACNAAHPHWKITAAHAKVYKTYLVKTSNVLFNVCGIPIFGLPWVVFPIQGHSKSGFLMPRFSYDYDYGFGIKQDYYKWISPHCDTTLGFNWRSRRGVVFSDEFRWARSPESYTVAYGKYGIVHDSYHRNNSTIERSTKRRYRVQGYDFQEHDLFIADGRLNTLMRVDFGTDKQLGYHFFNNTADVDDTFYNTFIGRLSFPLDIVSLTAEVEKTTRQRFTDKASRHNCDDQRVITEIEDRVHLTKVPRLEWNTAFRKFTKQLFYRHDFFVDQILYRQQEKEVLYCGRSLMHEQNIMPLSKADLLRFYYRGQLKNSFRFFDNTFSLYASPTFQVTSQLKDGFRAKKNVLESNAFGHGSYRLFAEYGAEWALPEFMTYSPDYWYQYAIQPIVSWEFVPKFFQNHWFYLDKYDRAFPKNVIKATLSNNLIMGDHQLSLDLHQEYDFYNSNDRFVLRRGLDEKHLLPFRYDFYYNSKHFYCGISQEIEWKNLVLLQSEINTGLNIGKVNFGFSYLFQKPEIQRRRELLSNIPHFFEASCSIPFGDHGRLVYEGQLYAKQQTHPFALEGITPLIHRLRFEYDGHCWGFHLGFEQKKYREFGMPRNERAIVFSLRLDSIGSFAKKFRKPFAWKD